MFYKIKNNFPFRVLGNNLLYQLLAVFLILLILNIIFIYGVFFLEKSDPVYILGFLLTNLITILVLSVLIVSNKISILSLFNGRNTKQVSQLRKKIIIAFSIGSALPTIIVSVFSAYFFNFRIESWFDHKISTALNQSIHVAESYRTEHTLQLKDTSRSVSNDIGTIYYDLIYNSELFNKVLNTEAEIRYLDEAIIFQTNPNVILAKTNLAFSLSFVGISDDEFERANLGEAVEIKSDPTKIRILTRLHGCNNAYLLTGKFIDSEIINHIDKTNGAAAEYFQVKTKISSMQIKFSIVFILLSLILLLCAIIWSRRFAEQIVHPIKELVKATEEVKNGNLSVQIPVANLRKDEIKILSSAFNQMVNQINHQKHELIIAEHSLAWSDVARKVAHEIKNPLTPIQLSAEFLLTKFVDKVSDKTTFTKYINNILNHSHEIKTIISEFVEFARLPKPKFVKCDIISMISDLIRSRELINDSIDYHFTTNHKEIYLACDIAQINRAMVNLLLNSEESLNEAKKYKRIETIISYQENTLEIIVIDNGKGFSNQLLKLAKEPYITTKQEGTGLGLVIVERIMTDHYGRIAISNNNQGGAEVKLIFDISKLTTPHNNHLL